MLELLLYSVFIAIGSVVFSYVLIDEDMILGFYGKMIKKLPDKLSYPLGECAYCFGGQVSLWYYIIKFDYRIDMHLFFILTTIFLIHLTRFIYEQTG